ncbi:MAG: glycosyltransferase family 2 protein [Rudaea sp.]
MSSSTPEMTSSRDQIEVSDTSRLVQEPLVSVLMITYNHAEYLAEAIEGVVSQKCGFPFELIIGEDASTDDTRQIALDWQQRYPEIIRVVYSPSNVGMNANARRVFAKARGKYLAFCEGDDYWCAADKLARQVELIEADPGVAIVHADWIRMRWRDGAWYLNPGGSVHQRVSLRLLQGDLFSTWHFPKILRTCTVLLRRQTVQQLLDSGLARRDYKFGDSVKSVFAVAQGLVAYVPEIVAVYRVSPNSALRSGAAARVAFYKSSLEFDTDARAFFAQRGEYGPGYRWEACMGLFLWSLRARDARSALSAIKDMYAHFGPIQFLLAGWKSVCLRWPVWRKHTRAMPRRDSSVCPGSALDQ